MCICGSIHMCVEEHKGFFRGYAKIYRDFKGYRDTTPRMETHIESEMETLGPCKVVI